MLTILRDLTPPSLSITGDLNLPEKVNHAEEVQTTQ